MATQHHICMVVKNQLWNDARVKKEALTLASAGYGVTIIAQHENGKPARDTWNGCSILRPRKRSRQTDRIRKTLDAGYADKEPEKLHHRLLNSLRRNPMRRFLFDSTRTFIHEFRLLRGALSAKADVYHAHDLDTLLVCWLAAKLRRSLLVYDSHELWLESQRYLFSDNWLSRLTARFTEKLFACSAHMVIAVTEMRGRHMKELYPCLPEPLIVKNCPDVSELPEGGSDYLRERTGAGKDCRIVLYQGILSEERGLEELVRAAAILRDRGVDDVHVVLIGKNYLGNLLENMVVELELADMVTILPPVESEMLPALTVSADIGLILFQNTCLNHFYSLPNKLYEYMMAGIPMIASDFPELASVIQRENCGLLVDPSIPEAIAEGILELSRDIGRRSEMGSNGREAATKRCNWSSQEDILLGGYEALLGQR